MSKQPYVNQSIRDSHDHTQVPTTRVSMYGWNNNSLQKTRISTDPFGSTSSIIKSHDNSEAVVGVFGELLIGHKVDDIVVTFKYPYYNTDFDMKTAVVTGDGAVAVSDSMLSVSSTTGTAQAETLNSVRYRAGHTGFIDFTSSFTGSGEGWAGGFDDGDGFFIHLDNGVASVGRRRGETDTEVLESSWNGDISPDDIDWSKINIFRIIYGYLGVANAVFQIRLNGWKTLHIMETEGQLTTTTVANPTFPVRLKTSGAMAIKVGSINAGTLNGSDIFGARYFSFSGSKTLSGTTLANVANFHNKTTYKTVANKVKASLLRLKIFVDAPADGTGTVQFKIIKGGTFTGTPSYTDVDANNSVIEYDTTVTYASGGKEIYTDWVGYSASNSNAGADLSGHDDFDTENLGLYLLPNEHVCITAQNVAGSTNVTVRVVFNWIELF